MKKCKHHNTSIALLGVLFFFAVFSITAQINVSGNLSDCSRCKVQLATYEGHENTILNAVRTGVEGNFVLPLPKLSYEGYYKLEVESLQGEQLFSGPVWVAQTDIFLSGVPENGFANLFFKDEVNATLKKTTVAINRHHDRLEYLTDGEGLFEGSRFEKQRTKAIKAEKKALEKAYEPALKAAPSALFHEALLLRPALDTWLQPLPKVFEASVFERVNWQLESAFHEPIIPEFITTVFRHYLSQPNTKTSQQQGAFIDDFTLAIWEKVPRDSPIGISVYQLLRNGYRQIEAWDALDLLDSLQGKEDPSKTYVAVADAINWLAVDASGSPVSSNQFLGQSVLLVFWSPLCGYCNAMLEEYEANRSELHEKGITVIGVTMDSGFLPKNKINAFHHLLLDEEYLPPGAQLEGQTISSNFRFSSTPAYFLIGPDGKLVKRFFTWDEALAYSSEKE